MGHRLTRIYTRTGDDGTTGLGDATRVPKDGPRVAAIGTVDELNSALGLVLAEDIPAPVRERLVRVQHRLFDLGGELSVPGHEAVGPARTAELEADLDALNAALPPLEEFILPGGGRAAAACHLARAVARRAERDVLALSRAEPVNAHAITYLNRLSDLLFVAARVLARESGAGEVYWRKDL